MNLKWFSLAGFLILVLAVFGLIARGSILAGTPVMIAAISATTIRTVF